MQTITGVTIMLKRLFILSLLLAFAGVGSAQVVEEITTIEDGMMETCGDGPGLDPCPDIDDGWEGYDEKMTGPDFEAEEDEKMAEEAAHIRNESPEALEKTLSKLEKK
jgi:hypothetical protein